jgi:Peptidase family C25
MPKPQIDESFFAPRTPVSIAAIGDSGEALLIRSCLESLGAVVTLHLIGTPGDFLKVLSQSRDAPRYLVICGHGDENGFVFGEYESEIDISALTKGSLPATALSGRISLSETIVISTACDTGSLQMAEAFLKGGAAAYIAPNGYPGGSEAALFVHMLFHQIMVEMVPASPAVETVRSFHKGFEGFTCFIE